MERMKDLEEMLRELSEKYKNSKSVEVYEEDLEGWFKIIDDLREENKNLNIKVASLEGEIKGLNSVIDKLHKEIEEQEAEGGGLFDEIDYRKRECKKLKEELKWWKDLVHKAKEFEYDEDGMDYIWQNTKI